jgi:hypothetical protein
MAATAKVFGHALKAMWANDTIKVALFTSSFEPSQDVDESYSSLTNEVANGNGYTTAGATLGTKTSSYVTETNVLSLKAADPSWSNATITARYAVIYDDTQTGKPVLGYIDFGADITSTNGTFTIPFSTATSGVVLSMTAS